MKSLLLLTSILFSISLSGQNIIAVQQGGNATFYSNIDSAITHSVNGDTIYLPGGSFSIAGAINKSIHIVGAGSDFIDSSLATGITRLNGVWFDGGFDGGSIEGVSISPGLYNFSIIFGGYSNYNAITNFSVSRNYLQGGIKTLSSCSLFSINQNVISGAGSNNVIYAADGSISNSSIINNEILGVIVIGSNNYIGNNIFFYNGNSINALGCTIENNIFHSQESGGQNCIFNNNINASPYSYTGNIGANNFFDSWSNTFINSNNSNYNLNPSSPGKNGGTDGTDIGIYGGSFSWKDGMVPSNPHIQTKNISGVTDTNGNLHINIKVAAQDH